MKTQKNKVYAAGIVNTAEGEWAWQGTVVAESMKEAKKLLADFKKEKDIKGSCEVMNPDNGPKETKRPKGVSDSMRLS